MNRRQIRDITAIMDVEPAMIPFLGRLEYPDNMLNPWGSALLGELAKLGLGPRSQVLDVPCGTGGVAVLVAKEFAARIRGYDLLPSHVAKAVVYSEQAGCRKRCDFSVGDLREVVQEERGYDAVLWVAAPHVWADAAETIRALRRCVRPGGTVLIADAYRPPSVPEVLCPGYQTLQETTSGLQAAGDTVFLSADPETDWERDFEIAHRAARDLLNTLSDPPDRRVVKRYIEDLEEAQTRESVGSAIWRVVRREAGTQITPPPTPPTTQPPSTPLPGSARQSP